MPTADELLGVDVVGELVACLGGDLPTTAATVQEFGGLGLGERARALRDALLEELPQRYSPFEKRIRSALRSPEFTGWMIWPVTEAVAVRATTTGNIDAGLALTADLTPRLTAEWALRTFLDADLDRTLATALRWTTHHDEHVRRLASEGTRPFLPWGRRTPALTSMPTATTAILDALYRDESEYVRRSVANHLNDLSRTDPELVVTQAEKWLAEPDQNTRALVRHALRTLVKKGDPDALALLGFGAPVGITAENLTVDPPRVTMGDAVTFTVELVNASDTQSIAVDYVVHHVRANGSRSPKVFKLTTRTLESGARETITRTHSFKAITTRRYYPGEHVIEIQVNGASLADAVFSLDAATDTMLA